MLLLFLPPTKFRCRVRCTDTVRFLAGSSPCYPLCKTVVFFCYPSTSSLLLRLFFLCLSVCHSFQALFPIGLSFRCLLGSGGPRFPYPLPMSLVVISTFLRFFGDRLLFFRFSLDLSILRRLILFFLFPYLPLHCFTHPSACHDWGSTSAGRYVYAHLLHLQQLILFCVSFHFLYLSSPFITLRRQCGEMFGRLLPRLLPFFCDYPCRLLLFVFFLTFSLLSCTTHNFPRQRRTSVLFPACFLRRIRLRPLSLSLRL